MQIKADITGTKSGKKYKNGKRWVHEFSRGLVLVLFESEIGTLLLPSINHGLTSFTKHKLS